MKHIPYLALLLTVITFSAACTDKKAQLSKCWFYTYQENAGTRPTGSAADPVLDPTYFINLQKDTRYTSYMGSIDYGEWSVDGKYIVLKNVKGKARRIYVHKIGEKEMALDLEPANEDKSVNYFEGTVSPYKDDINDPFTMENNRWRIPPVKKETAEEIVDRLKNHFRYWEKYFDWGLKTGKNSLDVRSLRGPLKMYGNGFELVPFENWPDEWKACFFDEEDQQAAYDKLLHFMQTERIAWSKTDHKFKMFISAFQQVQQKLR
ncbi:MAG: hypothetical protein P0Y53_24785 [Candidatus Pseudobacter hemicellulosilyticus]|uniref:Lipoprotein n=1 Tax=Candidatus Pseudobacter hemicellulosilyticus TaxID=3121375 RepID=A0AAJ5WWM5_9BACT|nr:MAG: hypothetical protein P0Y53_24785 [Pseudobacter sp.]